MDIQTKITRAKEFEKAGNPGAAGAIYQEILKAAPGNPIVLHNFGLFHAKLNHPDQAWQLFIKSLEADPSQPQVWVDLASILFQVGDFKGTGQAVKNALQLNPEFAGGHFWLGALNAAQNNQEIALQNFEKTIALDPYYLAAYKEVLARRSEPPEGEIAKRLEGYLKDPEFDQENRALLHSLLAGIFEKAGNADRFFYHLNRANKLQRGLLGDWQAEFIANMETLKSADMRKAFLAPPLKLESQFTPIFIVSLPRSGSTLIEQILATHPEVSGGGEMPFFANVLDEILFSETGSTEPGGFKDLNEPALTRLSEIYQQKAQSLGQGKPFITDKLPWNFGYIGHIARVFPGAKIINISRDPVDCGFSIYKHFFLGPLPFLCDHADYALYRRNYQDLMAYWHELKPGFVHDIKYQDLVENPEPEIRKLLKFCGLDWDPRVLDFHKNPRNVATLSLSQVKEPLNKKGLGTAQKYFNHLAPLISALKKYDLL